MKKPFTINLECEDIKLLQALASRTELPPHTLARSLLLRALKAENIAQKVAL
jgi:hypothetical protein